MKDETKEAFQQIQRDLKKWGNDKIDLEAAIVKMEAEIEYLSPELTELREKGAKLRSENEKLEHERRVLDSDCNTLRAEVGTLAADAKSRKAELAELETKLAAEKAAIDQRVSDYETAERTRLDRTLSAEEEQLTERRDALATVISEMTDLLASKEEAARELADFTRDASEQRTKISADINRLADRNGQMTQENHRLGIDNEALIEQQADLRSEYIEWEKKVTEFKLYEDKAWAQLNAKDHSLQEREQFVAERENLRPPKSFLPPVDA